MSDIVERLQDLGAVIKLLPGYDATKPNVPLDAADEIQRLRAEISDMHRDHAIRAEERWSQIDALTRWKSEAMQVLAEWEHVWEAAGRPGRLGSSKAAAVKTKLERLQEHS